METDFEKLYIYFVLACKHGFQIFIFKCNKKLAVCTQDNVLRSQQIITFDSYGTCISTKFFYSYY
jgi:hypothetical protein